MKRAWKFILVMVMVLFPCVVMGQVQVSVQPMFNVYTEPKLEPRPGLKLRVGTESMYLWGSAETTLLRYGGQQTVDINLFGMGLGAKKKFDNITLWIEGGYYIPQTTLLSIIYESGYYEFYDVLHLASPAWTHYEYTLKSGIGGAIGGSIAHVFTEHWSIGLVAEYRYLRLNEHLVGCNGSIAPPNPWWEIFQDRDFSAYQIGVEVQFTF